MLSEFAAKKIGEVLAFAVVGQETFALGRQAAETVFGAEAVKRFIDQQQEIQDQLTALAEDEGTTEITIKKSEGTGAKLRTMRDSYLQGDWEDSAELLEWLGFFLGGAVVHWNLVVGASESAETNGLGDLSQTSLKFYHDLLHAVSEQLRITGQTRQN